MDKHTPGAARAAPGYDSLAELAGGIEFLKTSNGRLSRAIMLMAIALLVVAGLAVASFLHQSRPAFFAVTPDLRVVALTPLDQPSLTQDGVKNWTIGVITKTFSLSFVHWREQLTEVSGDYTPEAFQALLASLKQSGLITLVSKQRLDAAVSLTGAAVVTDTYTQNGILYVRVQVPVVISYESSSGVAGQQNLVANVLVRRVPVTYALTGVAIEQIVMQSAPPTPVAGSE